MSAGLIALDQLKRVVFVSRGARALLGLSELEDVAFDFAGFLEMAVRAGALRSVDVAGLYERLMSEAGGPEPQRCELLGGRFAALHCRAIPGEGWAVTVYDVTLHHEAEHRAIELAHSDALTGLGNRSMIREHLGEAAKRAVQRGETSAVLCLNLDRFKAVNDTLGHPMGDALLRTVADRLRSAVRDSDLVARIGGDEFAVLQIGGEQPKSAAVLAQRLVDLIGRVYVIDGQMMNVGASVGVALPGQDGASPDDILKNADLALYRAKADDGGAVRFFEREMDVRIQTRRAMEMDLRRALALGEFEVHYQPQIRLDTSEVIGCEALMRWRNAERGAVSPAEFIPLAEEIGLIVPMGEWILRTACIEAARWPEHVSVAVNLSAVQAKRPQLFSTVVSALANAGLAPERLELEITEGILLNDTTQTLDMLKRLRDLGVRFSLDDFGTGYSSLSYLQKFPFDKIKIDQSFVRNIMTDPDCAAIVRAVVGLGASLGMRTTAEGVETVEQLERIRQEGCNEVQGYLIARPMGADELNAFLAPPDIREAHRLV